MGSTRIVALAGLLAVLVSSGIARPAFAEADTDGVICSVNTDDVIGTSAQVIGIRVQAFDCAGAPVAFHGTVGVAESEWRSAAQTGASAGWFPDGPSTPRSAIESMDGTASVALVDTGSLDPGWAQPVFDLYSSGDTTPYEQPAGTGYGLFSLTEDWNNPYDTSTPITHAFEGVPYSFMRSEQSLWGCSQVIVNDGTCVLDERGTSDQTWQKGYKLTMAWPDPGVSQTGAPYTRCRVWATIWMTLQLPGGPNGTYTMTYSPAFDVPADWRDFTVPLGNSIRFPSSVVPGTSTIDVQYQCYLPSSSGHLAGPSMTAANQLIPDLPPTAPSTVGADPAGTGIDVSASGSAALGTSPLQGYQMSVLDGSGQVVGSADVPADPVVAMRRTTSSTGTSSSAHRFNGLAPGTYTVQVSAYNGIGSSDATSTEVVVAAQTTAPPVVRGTPAMTAPRGLQVKSVHGRIIARWSTPKHVGAGIRKYIVRVLRGHHVVQTSAVRPSGRSFTSRRVTVSGHYRLTVTAVPKHGHSTVTAGVVTLRR